MGRPLTQRLETVIVEDSHFVLENAVCGETVAAPAQAQRGACQATLLTIPPMPIASSAGPHCGRATHAPRVRPGRIASPRAREAAQATHLVPEGFKDDATLGGAAVGGAGEAGLAPSHRAAVVGIGDRLQVREEVRDVAFRGDVLRQREPRRQRPEQRPQHHHPPPPRARVWYR